MAPRLDDTVQVAPRKWRRASEHAAALLIELDGFEQRLKIPFAEALVALALNDLEEDRADRILAENLQQDPGFVVAVDEMSATLKLGHRFTVTLHPRIDTFVVGRGSFLEFDAAAAQGIHRLVDIAGTQGDVLNAFAFVLVQIFFDLALVVLALVDGDANLAAGRGERAREQTGLLAFDAEVANLPEVEQLFVKAGPHAHVAAPDVVSEVIDAKQAHGNRRLGVDNRYEVDIVDGALAVAIDQINQAAADPLDRRDIEFHGTRRDRSGFGAQIQGARIGQARVGDAKRHGAGAGPVSPRKALRETVVFGIDDEIDVALIGQRPVFGARARDRRQSHGFEQAAQQFRVGRGVLDEFEPVGAHGIGQTQLRVHREMMILFCEEMTVPNT